MSDMSMQQELSADQQQLDENEVKTYLKSHPQFFSRHPDILPQLRIPHGEKGSVSLFELQSEQLRAKVNKLQSEMSELVTVAKQNEQIYRIYADLNLKLCRCLDLAEVQQTLEQCLLQQSQLSAIRLRFFDGDQALSEFEHKQLQEKRFKEQDFYFGRLSQTESLMLFNTEVESVALVRLGEAGEDKIGVLAIASDDAGHFYPDMDTLLLSQLQQCLNMVLPPILDV